MAWDVPPTTATPTTQPAPQPQPQQGILVSPQTISASGPKRPRIMIACPNQGLVPMEWVEFTWVPLHQALDWCEKILYPVKTYGLPHARNACVQAALEMKCDYIMWVDADIVMESITGQPTIDPNAGLKVLFDLMKETGCSILGGLFRAKQKTQPGLPWMSGFQYAAWIKPVPDKDGKVPLDDKGNPLKGFVPIQSWSGNYLRVDVSALGFMLMKVDTTFAKLKPPWFHWDMISEISEDFSLLVRCYDELQEETHVFTDVRLTHLGDLCVTSAGEFRVRNL